MSKRQEDIGEQLAHIARQVQPQISHGVATLPVHDPLFQLKPYNPKSASDANKNNDGDSGNRTALDLAQARELLLASATAMDVSKPQSGQKSASNNLSQQSKSVITKIATSSVEAFVSQSPGKSPVIGINSAPGDVTEVVAPEEGVTEREPDTEDNSPLNTANSSCRSSIYYSHGSPLTGDFEIPAEHKELASEAISAQTIPPQTSKSPKTFWQKSFKDKMKHVGILALYAVTAIDLRAEEAPKPGEKRLTTKEKIVTNIISVIVAIGSGFTTGVAIVGMPIPKFLEYLLGLTARTAPWIVGIAGYRVNMGVYKGAIEYTYKSIMHEGAMNEWLTKDPKTGRPFVDNTGKVLDGKWVRMSLKKCAGVLGGIFLTYFGSLALAIFTFVSMNKGLIAIFTAVHLASAVCPPLAVGIAAAVAVISLVAVFSLMYKSFHTAIRENAFASFIKFVKDLVPPSEFTTQQKIRHYIVSACKVLFIIGGITLAIIATVATLGAWSKSLVDAITMIDAGWAKFANIFSPIAVWGFTAAGRFPMVLEKAANVFSSIGAGIGNAICWCGEKLHIFKPEIQTKTTHDINLWQTIKNQCSDEKTGNFSLLNTTIFAGKALLLITGLYFVAYYVTATIFTNAGGNGAVADEGGSVLAKMLGWLNIHPSPSVAQNTLPLIAGGSVSAILGLDAAKSNYIDRKEVEMDEIPSNQLTNNASMTASLNAAATLDSGRSYQSLGVKPPSTYLTDLQSNAGTAFQYLKSRASSLFASSSSQNGNDKNRDCNLLSWCTNRGSAKKDLRPLLGPESTTGAPTPNSNKLKVA